MYIQIHIFQIYTKKKKTNLKLLSPGKIISSFMFFISSNIYHFFKLAYKYYLRQSKMIISLGESGSFANK